MSETGKRFSNTTPSNFRDIFYTVIHREVMRLQTCRSKKERENIRHFLIKAFELSGEYIDLKTIQ